jgi:predicted phosphoribosyltransferase
MLPDTPPFIDRRQAGRSLSERLGFLAGREDVTVIGLAPSAIAVAAEVADALDAPLELLVVRPLSVPGPSEVAIGAVTSGGTMAVDEKMLASLKLPAWAPGFLAETESEEAARLETWLRGGRAASDLRGRVLVIVDDGQSSNAQLKAAVAEVMLQRPIRVCVASPVLAIPVEEELREMGAEIDPLYEDEVERREAAGFWYLVPAPTPLTEVRRTIESARRRSATLAWRTVS